MTGTCAQAAQNAEDRLVREAEAFGKMVTNASGLHFTSPRWTVAATSVQAWLPKLQALEQEKERLSVAAPSH